MISQQATPRVWRFFRAGGFDQVRLDRGSDLAALDALDQKLWGALSHPTHGLEFDELLQAPDLLARGVSPLLLTAIVSLVTCLLGFKAWQLPVALAGMILLLSGPSMVIAWFKLRERNPGPIPGWAVNARRASTSHLALR
ncbi:MAG: hypothetical protein AB1513_05260 [Pseudomonadota bacterium]